MKHLVQIYEKFVTDMYHFTYLKNVLGMLEDNAFNLSRNNLHADSWYNIIGYKSYYMSFTRNRRWYEGYNQMPMTDQWYGDIARITVDCETLAREKSREGVKFVPLNYGNISYPRRGYSDGTKNYRNRSNNYHNNETDVEYSLKYTGGGFEDQREERLIYQNGYIEKTTKYIKRIDVAFFRQARRKYDTDMLVELKDYCTKNNIECYLFKNVKEANREKKGTDIKTIVDFEDYLKDVGL